MKIKVPDVPGPQGVCWKQQTNPKLPNQFYRCTFKKRHKGPHQWEAKCPTRK